MAGTRIGVIGCAGRMGRMLIADIVASEGCELAGGAAKPGSAAVGQDLGELAGVGRVGIAATGDARQVLRDSDVAIDFTTPDATASHATLAAELASRTCDEVFNGMLEDWLKQAKREPVDLVVLSDVLEHIALGSGDAWIHKALKQNRVPIP